VTRRGLVTVTHTGVAYRFTGEATGKTLVTGFLYEWANDWKLIVNWTDGKGDTFSEHTVLDCALAPVAPQLAKAGEVVARKLEELTH